MSRRGPSVERERSRSLVGAVLLVCLAVAVGVLWVVAFRHTYADPPQGGSDYTPPAATPTAAAPADRVETVFVGDSVTYAGSPEPTAKPGKGSWVAHAIKAPNSPWSYAADVAASGETTAEMLDGFKADVLARDPEGVVILAGTDDLLAGTPAAETVDHVRQMVKKARSAGAEVWLASPPPSNELPAQAAALRDAEQQYAESHGVTFLDSFEALAGPDRLYKPKLTEDGRLPDQLGATVLGRSLAEQAAR